MVEDDLDERFVKEEEDKLLMSWNGRASFSQVGN